MAGGALLPFLPRAAGAAAGASEGYKRGGPVGALVGGAGGAAFPGLTSAGAGASEGYELGGPGGAAVGAVTGGLLGGKGKEAFALVKALGGAGKAVKGAKDATTIAREVRAAETAARVGKALPKLTAAEERAATTASVQAAMDKGLTKMGGVSVKPKAAEEIAKDIAGAQTKAEVGRRVQIGAERTGRPLGLTKEQVRRETGPVLDEAIGEASPVLPKKALQSVIDTMRAMPMAEREAYVARATSGKTKWQVENIRRTLEHLGLLLPVGAMAGAAADQ